MPPEDQDADGPVTAGTGSGRAVLTINDGSRDSVTVGTGSITYAIGQFDSQHLDVDRPHRRIEQNRT
jgi:hypothetical protein